MIGRAGRGTATKALAALVAAATPVFADTSAQLDAAFAVCTSLPKPASKTAASLEKAGWVADPKARDAAVSSGIFAALFKPDDLAYSLDNGAFMAASVLGNSSLAPNQPGFSAGALHLAVLAGELDDGYCILSGDAPLLERLKAKTTLETVESGNLHARTRGALGNKTVLAIVLHREVLQPLISLAKPQYVNPNDIRYDDVNVIISPAPRED